jgi:hypothetical protein
MAINSSTVQPTNTSTSTVPRRRKDRQGVRDTRTSQQRNRREGGKVWLVVTLPGIASREPRPSVDIPTHGRTCRTFPFRVANCGPARERVPTPDDQPVYPISCTRRLTRFAEEYPAPPYTSDRRVQAPKSEQEKPTVTYAMTRTCKCPMNLMEGSDKFHLAICCTISY